jgi:hypothetical protein
MEIGQGTIRRNPHSINVKRNVTPAEVLLLATIHHRNAQGSPLGDDWAVVGIAETVDSPSKPAEDQSFNPQTGVTIPARPAVPAKTHKRTNAEEVARLKKLYANARIRLENGQDVAAFESVFPGIMPKLPQTFDEIEDAVGKTFPPLSETAPVESEAQAYRNALLAMPRHALVTRALKRKLQVAVADDNTTIVDRIIAAEQPEPGEGVPVISEAKAKFLAEASAFTVAELKEQAAKHDVVLAGGEKKAEIIEALWLKIGSQPPAE